MNILIVSPQTCYIKVFDITNPDLPSPQRLSYIKFSLNSGHSSQLSTNQPSCLQLFTLPVANTYFKTFWNPNVYTLKELAYIKHHCKLCMHNAYYQKLLSEVKGCLEKEKRNTFCQDPLLSSLFYWYYPWTMCVNYSCCLKLIKH